MMSRLPRGPLSAAGLQGVAWCLVPQTSQQEGSGFKPIVHVGFLHVLPHTALRHAGHINLPFSICAFTLR